MGVTEIKVKPVDGKEDNIILFQKENKDESFRQTAAKNLNIVGVKYALGRDSSSLRRFCWTVALLGMLTYLVFQITIRVTDFSNVPRSVNIDVRYNGKMKFPAITICNNNARRLTGTYSYARHRIYSQLTNSSEFFMSPFQVGEFETHGFLFEFLTLADSTLQGGDKEALEEYMVQYASFMNLLYANMSIMHLYTSQQLDQMLFSCTWRRRPCGPENFTKIFTDLGVCYTFNGNSEEPLETQTAGPYGGLELILDAQQYEYMKNEAYHDNIGAGFKLKIHEQNESSAIMSNVGLLVSAGRKTSIGLKHEMFSELPPPVGSCDPDEYYSNCVLECTTKYVFDECNCTEVHMPDLPGVNASPCSLFQHISCSVFKQDIFTTLPNFTSLCPCQPRCERDSYGLVASSAPLSQFASTRFISDGKIPDVYEAARHIQDMQIFYFVNSSLNHMIIQFGSFLRTPYYLTSSVSPAVTFNGTTRLVTLGNFLRETLDTINSTENTTIRAMYDEYISIAQTILEKIQLLNDTWHSSFFFDFMPGYKENYLEDFYSRLAFDVVRNLNQYPSFCGELQAILLQLAEQSASEVAVVQHMRNTTGFVDVINIEAMVDVFQIIINISYHVQIQHQTSLAEYQTLQDEIQGNDKVKRYAAKSDNLKENFFESNVAVLSVYFEELSSKEIIQAKSDNAINLLCDMGGSIGLCLGGSLLTLVEIVDLLIFTYLVRPKRIPPAKTETQ